MSYDGAANISRYNAGMKTLVQTLFVWCHSQRFSLVIETSLDVCRTSLVYYKNCTLSSMDTDDMV